MDAGRLRENVERVRERIAQACRRAHRNPADVTVIAVTKTVPPEAVTALAGLGFKEFGENRPVEGAEKIAALGGVGRWHFIGHLQTNKINKVLGAFQFIHSLDREELGAALEKRLAPEQRRIPVFVQVNVSGEGSKGGVSPDALAAFLAKAKADWPHLYVTGLMTMAPASPDPETSRPHFRRLRRLCVDAGLPGLSMGMTGDFEIAIEEGATHLRIGSAFFEGLG